MKKWLAVLLLFLGANLTIGPAAHAGIYTDPSTGLTWSISLRGPLLTWEKALAYCEALEASMGDTEWRLPDINELLSLVCHDRFEPAAAIDDIEPVFYWSATTDPAAGGNAWGIDFRDGAVTQQAKTGIFYVMAVSRGSVSPGCAPEPGNEDGTVTDLVSGLTWEQTTGEPMIWEEALAHCESLELGGHTDWRLPDIHELQSLVRYEESNPAIQDSDCFKYGPFSTMVSDFFWSSTTDSASGENVWGVDFSDGNVTPRRKTGTSYVRAVRGGTAPSRCLEDNGNSDGTVTDPASGLIWGQAAAATADPMTWEAALKYCEELTLAGHEDWRLPDIDELQSLIRYDAFDPAIQNSDCYKYGPFPDMVSDLFWSSTTSGSDSSDALCIDFKDGDITTRDKTRQFYVRPVRSVIPEFVKFQAERPMTGEAPFLAELTADPVGILIDHYEWFLTGGPMPDKVTLDGLLSETLYPEGDYSIDVVAYDTQGRAYESNFFIEVLPPSSLTTLDEFVRFTPHYPVSRMIPSLVMKGGKAIRHYRVYDADSQPVTGKVFYYKYPNGTRFETITDGRGFVEIMSPPVVSDGNYRIIFTDKYGIRLNIEVVDAPTFSVTATDRTFTEEYRLLLGMGESGQELSMGPLAFRIAELGLYSGTNLSTDIRLENVGSRTDMAVKNRMELSEEMEGMAGLSAEIFKEQIAAGGRPELSASTGEGAAVNTSMTTRHHFEDYLNPNRPDTHDQRFVAATLFFENLIKRNPACGNHILTQAILEQAIDRICETIPYYQRVGFLAGATTQFSTGAELTMQNPLGLLEGLQPTIHMDAFEAGSLLSLSAESDVDEADNLTFTLSTILNPGSFFSGFSQKFDSDRPYPDVPKFSLSSDLLQKQIESEMTIAAESTAKNDRSIGFSLMTGRAGPDIILPDSAFTETYFDFRIDAPTAVEFLEGQSELFSQLREGDAFDISESAYLGAMQGIQDLPEGIAEWETHKKHIRLFSLPLTFGENLGLELDLTFRLDVKSVLDNITATGLLIPEKGMIKTALYERDLWIDDNIKGIGSVIDEFVRVIDRIIGDVLETVEKTKEAGQELVVESDIPLADGGATAIAGPEGLTEDATLKLSRLTRFDRSASIAGGTAATVGDLFIVTIAFSEGILLTDLIEPLELTIGYREADLDAAGFTAAHAEKLRIYGFDPKTGYYRNIGGELNAENRTVSVSILRTGQYILAVDTAAPAISDFIIMEGGESPLFRLTISDCLSGLNPNALEITLDGLVEVDQDRLPEVFNPRTGLLEWRTDQVLAEGEHQVKVTAQDTTGNTNTETILFFLDLTPPDITHTPITQAPSGAPLEIRASITENRELAGVFLCYRARTDELPFKVLEMTAAEGASEYIGSIPESAITSKGVRYYIKAADIGGNVAFSAQTDIDVQDTTSPAMVNGLMVISEPEGIMRIYWYSPPDADVAGYRVYIGASADSLTLFKDVGLTNWISLEDAYQGKFIAVSAYDELGNESEKTPALNLEHCAPGDVNCSGGIDLADALICLKIMAGISGGEEIRLAADVDENLRIGLEEALFILRYLTR